MALDPFIVLIAAFTTLAGIMLWILSKVKLDPYTHPNSSSMFSTITKLIFLILATLFWILIFTGFAR